MAKKTILLVDDEVNILEILKVSLEDFGYNCLTATDGKMGLEIFKKNKVNYIISDRKMTGMSGIEFLIEIRKISKVPFFIFSSELRIEEDAIAFRSGASQVIKKPIEVEVIVNLLKKI